MSGEAKKRLPKICYIAPNGIKIEPKGFGFVADYVEDELKTELAIALQVPKDMLFPTKVLALTDKNKLEGSIEVSK